MKPEERPREFFPASSSFHCPGLSGWLGWIRGREKEKPWAAWRLEILTSRLFAPTRKRTIFRKAEGKRLGPKRRWIVPWLSPLIQT